MISKTEITVRYAETDQMGIVHHSNYAIWYECARTEFIKKTGMTYTQMEEIGIQVPLVELHSKFIQPAFYEDELTVEVRIRTLTPVKIEFEYRIFRRGEERPINQGSTLHAWVTRDRKLCNLKKAFPALYTSIENML